MVDRSGEGTDTSIFGSTDVAGTVRSNNICNNQGTLSNGPHSIAVNGSS